MAHTETDKDVIKGSVTPVYAALNIVIGDKRETIFYNKTNDSMTYYLVTIIFFNIFYKAYSYNTHHKNYN